MIENLKKHFVVIILLILINSVSAADAKFYSVNSKFGISMRETNTICKDSIGFIWTASKTGILRITEDDYRLYQLPYSKANVITVKLAYDKGILIAYTNNGQIFKYNQLADKFELFVNMGRELNSNFLSINSVLIQSPTVLWVVSSNGLYKYDSGEIQLMEETNRLTHGISWIDDKTIVYGTYNGLLKIDITTNEISQIYTNDLGGFFEPSSLYSDAENKVLWFGTMSKGLFRLDLTNNKVKSYYQKQLPRQPILAIEAISDTILMIGIDGQGLWEVDVRGNEIYNVYKENIDNPYSLKGNGVYDIYCDENHRVWVSTYSGGVSYFDQKSPLVNQITHLPNNANSLVNNEVNCIIEDRNQNLWFATNNGVSCWNVEKNEWTSYYVNKQEQAQVFLTLCEDDLGRIWAGTYASGVYVLDGKSGEQVAHYSQLEEDSPFINEFVFDISKDSLGNIWIGGINSQVVRYRESDNSFRLYSMQPINVLTELNSDEMLLGCTYGLCLSNNETGATSILLDGSLIHDILVMDSIVWLGTSGDGLIRFNPETRSRKGYTTENGLPSNFVNSVTYASGFLWIGTENGLCRFDPESESAQIFSSIPLLSSNSFNRNAHFELSNGQLIWGTNNGVVSFNPETIEQVHSKGKIFLQDIMVSGRSIRDHSSFYLSKPVDAFDQIKLKYNQNTISIELVPIGVASGSKFSWKLEGLEDDWSKPAGNRVLSYSNIPSKDYSLKIRLYDNSLSHILAERTFYIKVTPPFWATSWFLIIVFVIVSSIIYFGFWYYINLLKQRHTEEKVRFFANTAHDLRTSLTLIKAPIEELSNETNLSAAGKYNINLANEQAMRLSTVVTQLMDFQKVDVGKAQLVIRMVDIVRLVKNRIQMFESLAASKDLVFEFVSNRDVYNTGIGEIQIEKVLDNLISNAVKYSRNQSKVLTELIIDDDKWEFKITDHGIGIDKKAQKQLFKEFYRAENAVNAKIVGSGIGLLLVKNYVDLHGGVVNFTSQLDEGSTFSIIIPYQKVNEQTNVKTEPSVLTDVIISQTEDMPVHELHSNKEKTAKSEMKLLLVEDNEDLLRFMETNLQEEFIVSVALDGEEAWEIIQKDQPDLVISDVMMPNKDGFELCKQLKSTFETSHIPLVLLTALAGKAEQLHGLGLGADDYLTKPFDMAVLRQKVKSIIVNRIHVRDKALKLMKGSGNEPVLNNELNNEFVKRMLEVVRENMSNSSFNKEVFASAMNVSSSLLYKKVKALTDQSPTDFIKSVRMDYAFELLLSRKYNVTEVSEMSGFSSIGYFSTVFKKHFGKSPTEV